MKYVIEGTYWSAGEDIFIDTQDEAAITIVCLNEFIKHHIEENSKITVIIDVDQAGK